MARALVDLLWRHHSDAPERGARGPRSRTSVDSMVAAAVRLADAGGLDAVTIRSLAGELGISPMSVYTHVEGREDLFVLMADTVFDGAPPPRIEGTSWRADIRRVAEANLELYATHPWLLDIRDDRLALGPGCIRRYDHELRAFELLELDDLDRDAALTFVLDFARAGAEARSRPAEPSDFTETWTASATALAHYIGDDYPLARRVGAAAGASHNGPHAPNHAWDFGLERVLDGLAALTGRGPA